MDYTEMRSELRQQVMTLLGPEQEYSDAQIAQIIEQCIQQKSKTVYMSIVTRMTLKQELFNSIRRLDLLQELLDDSRVTEIMVNGDGPIFYEQDGRIFPWDKQFESTQKLEDVIQQIVARANRQVNEASPIVDARLADGSRVNVVLAPVSLSGACLSIRKFPKEPITMDDLIAKGSLSPEIAAFLEMRVRAGYNIFVSGGTGSGKTTFLNALSRFIPEDQRVITIEDSAELQMRTVKNLVRLETRGANKNGTEEITIRDLIRTSLRMRPDRIIVGEVRGAETLDMLQAINTGHLGFLICLHLYYPHS